MAHILIVDDEPGVRDATRALLERQGHAISEEADGVNVVAAVAEGPPDLVIIDLGMPGQDGVKTIAALRREHPRLKILAVSGGDRLDQATSAGADAVLEKPYRSTALRELIAELLGLD